MSDGNNDKLIEGKVQTNCENSQTGSDDNELGHDGYEDYNFQANCVVIEDNTQLTTEESIKCIEANAQSIKLGLSTVPDYSLAKGTTGDVPGRLLSISCISPYCGF